MPDMINAKWTSFMPPTAAVAPGQDEVKAQPKVLAGQQLRGPEALPSSRAVGAPPPSSRAWRGGLGAGLLQRVAPPVYAQRPHSQTGKDSTVLVNSRMPLRTLRDKG
jgi:hypothetical protein